VFVITRNSTPSEEEVQEQIVRLCRLAVDLHEIRNGAGPSEDALRDAPVLENWMPVVQPAPCLVGEVSGHPRLPGAGRRIVTSPVWALAEPYGWALTLSRFYRLGRPHGPFQDA
jgi:hypothetical protein